MKRPLDARQIWDIIVDENLDKKQKKKRIFNAGREDTSKERSDPVLNRLSLLANLEEETPTDWMMALAVFDWLEFQRGVRRNTIIEELRNKKNSVAGVILDRAFSFTHSKTTSKLTGEKINGVFSHLTELVNQVRASLSAPPLEESKIFDSTRFRGPDAVKQIYQYLMPDTVRARMRKEIKKHGRVWQQFDAVEILRGKEKPYWLSEFFVHEQQSDERSKELELIRKLTFDAASQPQIVNVFQDGMWRGLSALALELTNPEVRQKFSCSWPVCYIALQSTNAVVIENSYREVIHRIWSFFLNYWWKFFDEKYIDDPRTHIDEELKVPKDFGGVILVIQSVQRIMSKLPAILIFDGYRIPIHQHNNEERYTNPSAPNALIRAITDDHVFNLIERLCSPPTSLDGAPVDLGMMRESKFVVLSDYPLYKKQTATDPERFFKQGRTQRGNAVDQHPSLRSMMGVSVELSFPHSELAEKVLESYEFQHPKFLKSLGKIRTETDKIPPFEQDKYRNLSNQHNEKLSDYYDRFNVGELSEKLLGLLSALICFEVPETKIFTAFRVAGRKPKSLIEQFSKLLVRIIKENPSRKHWLIFLQIIALCPEGARPTSLAHIYEALLEIDPEIGPTFHSSDLREMLSFLSGIIGIYKSDRLDGLMHRVLTADEKSPHSTAEDYRNHTKSSKTKFEHSSLTQRTVQFDFNEIADAILLSMDDQTRCMFHYLIAEEALSQHLIIALHGNLSQTKALRSYRRLLQVLYHGLASLKDRSLSEKLPVSGHARLIPVDTKLRWAWLYSEAYRRILDMPPEYLITRRFAADRVKLDLLRLFNNPAIAWGQLCDNEFNPPMISEQHSILIDNLKSQMLGSLKSVSFSAMDMKVYAKEGKLQYREEAIECKPENPLDIGIYKNLIDFNRGSIIQSYSSKTDAVKDIVHKILELRNDDVMGLILNDLKPKAFESYTREIEQKVSSIMGENNFKKSRGDNDKLFEELYDLDIKEEINSKSLINGLCQYAELTYTVGTLLDADDRMANPLNQHSAIQPVRDYYRHAFSVFLLADIFREQAYKSFPLRGIHILSGNFTKNWMRVALKLERISETVFAEASSDKKEKLLRRASILEPGWFWLMSVNLRDRLILNVSSFQREHPGLSVIEATMARYYCSRHNSTSYEKYLSIALRSLSAVENNVLHVGMNNRLRLRFMIERAKVFREKARMCFNYETDEKHAEGQKWYNLALNEIDTLKGIVKENYDGHWQRMADYQEIKIKHLKRK